MSRNWLRKCRLTLSGSSSISIPGGGPTDLQLQARIGASTFQTPNPASFTITNPNPQTITAFKNKEFQTVTFEAGYEDNCALLYSGEIKQSLYLRADDNVTSYMKVFCAEHANAYQQSHVNKSLAAGWTPRDKVQLALNEMVSHGITGLGLCNIDLDNPKRPRGRAIVGMARDILREVALSAGATWSMTQGKVNIIDPRKPLQSDGPIVLNSQTGLIGWPQQTEDGIVARCLINPVIKINTQIKFDESLINGAERSQSISTGFGNVGPQAFNLDNTGQIAADGLYSVTYWEVQADSRGQPWYMTLTMLATGASLNEGQLHFGLGISDASAPLVGAN